MNFASLQPLRLLCGIASSRRPHFGSKKVNFRRVQTSSQIQTRSKIAELRQEKHEEIANASQQHRSQLTTAATAPRAASIPRAAAILVLIVQPGNSYHPQSRCSQIAYKVDPPRGWRVDATGPRGDLGKPRRIQRTHQRN